MAIDLRQSSDGALVLAIARYHQDALAEVYRRHAGAVFGLANRLLASRALAEEVTQEIFLRLWNAPERFDPDRGTLRAMLLSWTHGKSVDVMRSDSSRRRREERDAHVLAEAGHDIENEAIELAIADQIARALASLRVEEREAITLAYYRGLTYREVAAQLDQPEGTVKSRIRSGLRTLRSSLNIHENELGLSVAEGGEPERATRPERPSEWATRRGRS
ncbi:MAG: sigma-70 family RNA polymerase sigma factor [Acidimicrobiales bacterium]